MDIYTQIAQKLLPLSGRRICTAETMSHHFTQTCLGEVHQKVTEELRAEMRQIYLDLLNSEGGARPSFAAVFEILQGRHKEVTLHKYSFSSFYNRSYRQWGEPVDKNMLQQAQARANSQFQLAGCRPTGYKCIPTPANLQEENKKLIQVIQKQQQQQKIFNSQIFLIN